MVAAGLKWAPAWAWPTNLFVWAAALYSVTAMDGLQSPWDRLAQRLADIEVRPVLFDGAYVARGVVPDGPQAAQTGGPAARRRGRRMAPVRSAPPKNPP
ncbi:hypothetical protein ABXN37_07450 [Piscinibacter sakaiensis]|uniref:hypothetical protein n=1 Tax=Piscinibacter sakaiensis TaxID=1547922 RepID=UPI00372B2D03